MQNNENVLCCILYDEKEEYIVSGDCDLNYVNTSIIEYREYILDLVLLLELII